MNKKSTSKHIVSFLFLGLLLGMALTRPTLLAAQLSKTTTEDFSIAYVLERGQKNSNTKHLYKDLLKGLRKTKADYQIDFVAISKANKALFAKYDAVIVINEHTTDTLKPAVNAFVTANKAQKNMIVVSFLPKGKSTLSGKTTVDIVSSASRERPATKLITKTVAPMVVDIIQSQ